MENDIYLIYNIKRDSGTWTTGVYEAAPGLPKSFPDREKAYEAAHSLQKLIESAGNKCIVKVVQEVATINFNR